ncbi:MAG: homogentisate 1,2-dioxygenase [Bdellovibrionales bacterium]
MSHYSQGQHTKQAHKGIPDGQFEEEQGLLGFFGKVSHLLKPKPSTRWSNIEGPLRPHMFDLVELRDAEKAIKLLFNDQTEISLLSVSPKGLRSQISYRNADGDLLYFCHYGEGELLTEYGSLSYNKGTYIVVPKCLGHTFIPNNDSKFFVVENKNSHFNEPDRGMVGRNAIYDTEALVKPNLDKLHKTLSSLDYEICKIVVKRMGEETTFTYEETVYDTLGWKGDLYPYTLHVDDIMPLMSHRAHLPPSAHTTFVARDFVVCTFLPRPLELDDDALKVPFYHQNIDYDEVLFYHDGDFFSRDNLHAGMMSFHPAGFPHGPHPKAVKSIGGKTETNEYAVMIDTRMPLKISNEVSQVELSEYWKSWMSK